MAYRSDSSQALLQILVDALATGDVQAVKILDGTADSGTPWKIEADGAARSLGDSIAAAVTSAVASAAAVGTIVAANAARRMLTINNFSNADLYIKYGAGASFTGTPSFLCRIGPGGYWEMPTRPIYTGLISGIWSSANGFACVTEG